jgi:hypothetical protein
MRWIYWHAGDFQIGGRRVFLVCAKLSGARKLYFRIFGYGASIEWPHHPHCFSVRMGLRDCHHVLRFGVRFLTPHIG